jgi:tripartite-type tricarboxylate transporter receptor subunit TctC
MRIQGEPMTRRIALLFGIVCALAVGATNAQLGTGTVRILVGVAPGGSADAAARVTATRLQEVLQRPVIVENRPGANHMIATKAAIASPPDGNTLLFGTVTLTVNPVLYPKDSVDPVKDLTPLSMLFMVNPLVVAVPKDLPVSSLRELVAMAKAKPGALNYSSGSSTFRVATEMLIGLTDMQLTYVPYNGAAPAMRALMAGEVQMSVLDVVAAFGAIKNGQIKGLAVSSAKRANMLPDVPSAPEAGWPAWEMDAWGALFGPPNMPPATVARVSEALMKAGQGEEIRQRFNAIALEPVFGTPQHLADRVKRDSALFKAVIEKAGIKGE